MFVASPMRICSVSPRTTELYQTANRSCPSGFVLGFRMTRVFFSISTVAGSVLAAS
jgi:hypothetical protein